MNNEAVIEKIRSFNRFYTKILGLVDNKILKTNYSLLEARILFEIFYQGTLSSSDLVRELNIDPSYLSRIVKKFVKNGLLYKNKSPDDSRKQILRLSEKGKNEFIYLQDISNNHIETLLEKISDLDKSCLLDSMDKVRSILSDKGGTEIITMRNHRMGDIGYLIHQHALFYSREYGFDISFESYVAKTMIKFIDTYDENKERLWIVEKNNRIMGSIAIVHVNEETAQLRWFLLESEIRGRGIGKKLITAALDFCRERSYKKVMLMTSSDLITARALYARYGFKIKDVNKHEIWGQQMGEEIWELKLD